MIELNFATWDEFDAALPEIVSIEKIITDGVKVQIDTPKKEELDK